MQKNIENYFLDLITGKQKGLISCVLRFLLWVLSWPYQLVIACRNWIFDRGWVSRYFPPVPVVISIGNIVVGGTGKTPATLMIAHEFYQDFLIAILSRGYRSPAEKLSTPIALSFGDGPLQSASFCGDEPFLIAENFPKALVIVGKNRHKASDIAARAGAQLILLDDGMQHRRLARDFEVVVMDSSDLFGQGYFLPRGLLRESVGALSRADLIILNHITDQASFDFMKLKVAKYSDAIVVGTSMEVIEIKKFNGEVVDSLQGKKIGIFCGIAHPDYFCKTVKEQGGIIVDTVFAADHMSIDQKKLAQFAKDCKSLGADLLICTEKDKVKISDIYDLALPIAWVKMRLKLVSGQTEWKIFMDKVKSDLKSRI